MTWYEQYSVAVKLIPLSNKSQTSEYNVKDE